MRPYVRCAWPKTGWDWSTTHPNGICWTVRELTSGRELFEEGCALHHCVASYAGRCAARNIAIFSLRADDQRCVTVEVDRHNRQVLQARGACNWPATFEEREVVQQWQHALGLAAQQASPQ